MIINVYTAKGGSGKTTICHNLAYLLASKNKRVLAIDCDAQASLTTCFGIDNVDYTFADALFNKSIAIEDTILEITKNIFLLPSSYALSLIDIHFNNTRKDRQLLSKKFLKKIESNFDFILIDNAPSISILQLNNLIACDMLISPIEPSYLSYKTLETTKIILDELNLKTKPYIILNKYNDRINDNKDIYKLAENDYDVLGTVSQSVNVSKIYTGLPIVMQMPNAKQSQELQQICKELIERMG